LNLAKACGALRLAKARDHRANVLPLEERVRRAARRSSQAPESLGAEESAHQTDCGEPGARSGHLERSGLGKLLSPARRREAVGYAVTVLLEFERRACRAIGQIRSSYRYRPRLALGQDRLSEWIIALAKANGRYGYRTVTDLLRREGWAVGKVRVYTIWRQEGLRVPTKQLKRARRARGDCA